MNRPASAPSSPGRSRRKWWKWAAGALVVYGITGFIILPLIVKWVAVRQLRTQLDREVMIQKLRINPFVLSATIRGLLINDKGGQPFISWDEFYANFQLSSFFGKAWVFKEIRLVQPFARAQMNLDYSMNFSDLVKKFSTPAPGPPPPPAPKKPLFLEVGKIEISGAGADFTDLTFNPPFHRKMGPLRLALNELRTDPNSKNPYSFSGTTDAGEKFSWSGYFSLDPLRSGGQLSFEGLLLPKYTQLLQRMVQFQIKDGLIGLRGEYQLAMGETNWTAMVTNADFSLEAVRLTAPGETESFAELDSLHAHGIHADIESRVAGIGEMNVSGGRLSVKRGRETGINLVQMSKPAETGTNVPGGVLLVLKAATNAIAALQSTTNLWSATLERFDLTNCAVRLDDLANSRPVNLTVDDIAISVRHLSNVPGSNQTAAFSARWNSNGTAGVMASAAIAPPSAEVTVALNSVELAPLSPYLEPFLDLRLLDGKVNVDWKLGIRMGSNGLPEIKLSGDSGLEDFATVTGPKDENLVKWKSFRVTGVSATVPPPSAEVKEVSLVGFEGGLAMETNHTFNVLNVLRAGDTNAPQSSASESSPPSSAPVASAPAAQPPATETKPQGLGQQLGGMLHRVLEKGTNADAPKFSVDTVAISNLMVKFQDHSAQPPAEVSLERFGGTITGISSDNLRRADARLAGKIGSAGPIEITGKLNPLSSQAPTEMQVTLRDVDLTAGSPYCGRFLGYRLDKGKLNLQLTYQVAQRQLKANNTLMLDQFTFGSKVDSPDATKLPVRLAVALLKDRQGQIKLEVPVEGNFNDPEFRYGKAVLHVLGNIVTKMITSPFTALGSLFGSGSKAEEVSYQDFAPGSSELTAANLGKLDTLLRGLEERPGLQLEIEGCAEPAADQEGLKRRKLESAMRQDKWSGLRKSEQARQKPDELPLLPEERQAYLEKVWLAILRTNAPAASARERTTAASRKPAVKPATAAPLDRRAVGLMKSGQISAPPGELEQNVLATISVSEEDLRQLAAERANRVQQKLLESGRLTPERIVLAETNQPSTNAAMRVYFHLQ